MRVLSDVLSESRSTPRSPAHDLPTELGDVAIVGALFRVLLLLGFALTYWWQILLLLAAAAAGVALSLWHQQQRDAAGRHRQESAALTARADQQHAWILARMTAASAASMHQSKSSELVQSRSCTRVMQLKDDNLTSQPGSVT